MHGNHSLRKRLNQIEARIGPPDPDAAAFSATKVRFLAILADDPFFAGIIEPEFRLAQVRLFSERGCTLRDVTVPPGVPTVQLREGATMDVPEGAEWDHLWLCLDPRAAAIREALDQTQTYLDNVWKEARG